MDIAVAVAVYVWRMLVRLVEYIEAKADEKKSRRADKWWPPDPYRLY